MEIIKGDLILNEDTTFNENIRVEGNIIGPYNLKVTGNIIAEDINALNINALKINAGNIIARNINAKDIIAEDIDALNINAEDIDARNIDAGNINALDIVAKDINAKDINAEDIDAWDINARNINAEDINAGDIIARNINARNIDARDIKEAKMEKKDYRKVITDALDKIIQLKLNNKKKTIEIKTKMGNYNIEVMPIQQKGVAYEDLKILEGWRIPTVVEAFRIYDENLEDFDSEKNDFWVKQQSKRLYEKNYIARFYSFSNGADLDCYRGPSCLDVGLGVIFVRDAVYIDSEKDIMSQDCIEYIYNQLMTAKKNKKEDLK